MPSPVPAELISSSNPEAAREQFTRVGHVGIAELYGPYLGEQALAEIRKGLIKSKPRGVRSYTARLRPPNPTREKAYTTIIEAIQEGARILGRDIAPAASGEAAQIDLLEMEKDGRGDRHRDKTGLVDIVAVANLTGVSGLRIEDGDGSGGESVYTFGPGPVIYHDLSRQLVHQGFTGPDDSRFGLAVAKYSR